MRKSAAQALQKILDIQVMPKLIQALTDEYADIRKEAAIGKFLIIKLLLTVLYH
ncbi:hypothetical protein [Nostoc sp.]|uniref:hypothetical protein n=1 Tax=Nostoc sp. TaxID=1180 RepID=UPI002FFBB629